MKQPSVSLNEVVLKSYNWCGSILLLNSVAVTTSLYPQTTFQKFLCRFLLGCLPTSS